MTETPSSLPPDPIVILRGPGITEEEIEQCRMVVYRLEQRWVPKVPGSKVGTARLVAMPYTVHYKEMKPWREEIFVDYADGVRMEELGDFALSKQEAARALGVSMFEDFGAAW